MIKRLFLATILSFAALSLLVPSSVFALAPDSERILSDNASGKSKNDFAPNELPPVERDRLLDAANAPVAPPLATGTWINSKPLALESLRGRVVLLDFWTFNCHNCRNTLPALKRFDARYRAQGLTVIGVHSPEGDYAKDLSNVRRQVRTLGINYPVVTDNDYASWRAFNMQAWPTVVLLDKKGRVRFVHIGESMYAEREAAIRKLLAE